MGEPVNTIAFTTDAAGRWHYLCTIHHDDGGAVYDDDGTAGFATIEEAAADLGRSLGVTVDPAADQLVRYGKTLTITRG